MSFCKDCVQGVTYEGAPEGKVETIGGVACYVATPTVDYPKDKVILFLTDVYGIPLPNSRLLADDFARNGLKVVMPDYLHGDPIPLSVLKNLEQVDLGVWIETHHASDTRPLLDNVIAALKADFGVTTFGAVGYCFGGRYVFDLAFDNVIVAGATAHPSLLKIPDDLEKYVATSNAPLLINSCELDDQFTADAAVRADEVFAGFSPGYKREHWEGCAHGFATRGDPGVPKVKAGKEGAFKATVEWFIKYM
ncbi:dienelactone hydrolase [Mycena galericulata]|nr:dienelactone hydrolase [Mycena galericulata]